MEIWKDIPGYDEYQVSNLGRVRSCKSGKEKILKLTPNKNGYLKVNLCKDTKIKKYCTHQLVTMTFLGHIPNGLKTVVDHINQIKTDNRLENLRLVTQRENTNFSINKKNTSSKYVGVTFHKVSKKWISNIQIDINNKQKYLGLFRCELPAAVAYNKALKELNKEKI